MIVANSRKKKWELLLQENQIEALKESFDEAPLVDVAEFISEKDWDLCASLFSLFDLSGQAEIFAHFTEEHQKVLYTYLPRRRVAEIFAEMPSNVRVDFYQSLEEGEQSKLLPFLPKSVKQDVLALCAYSEETAGGIMSTNFATLDENLTLAEALKKLRKNAPSRKMMYHLYVVDQEMRVKSVLPFIDLVFGDPKAKIKDIMQKTALVSVKVSDDRELVAQKIAKYGLVACPVLNEEEQLVGIVDSDDALEVISEEATEDMERFMGIEQDDEGGDYLETSSVQHFKKRVTWIFGLFVLGFGTAAIMHGSEKVFALMPILFFYLPTISDVGGNIGSQAATVVIRALSLRQVTISDWLRILIKELKVGFIFVIPLFMLGIFKVIFFSGFLAKWLFGGHYLKLPDEGLFILAAVFAISLSLQVLFSTFIGTALPLFIKWRGGDPALAASPAITTIVDMTGLLIYVLVAQLMLTF